MMFCVQVVMDQLVQWVIATIVIIVITQLGVVKDGIEN